MQFSLLSLPSFTPYCDRALYQTEHYLTYRSGVIFEVPKCLKMQIFRGSVPDRTPLRELAGRASAYIAPLDLLAGGEGLAAPSQ